MLEANPEKEKELKKVIGRHPSAKIEYEIALLDSKAVTDKTFYLMETASSALEENLPVNAREIKVQPKTLNQVLAARSISSVSILKLDVQGYEVEILKGGNEILPHTEAVLLEISLLDIHKNVPLLKDVLNFMYEYQFVAYDICSVSARRPLDRALWQTDVLFVKENAVYRQNKAYYKP